MRQWLKVFLFLINGFLVWLLKFFRVKVVDLLWS